MTSQMLIRNVPENIRSWIDRERKRHVMSKQEFLVSLLERACRDDRGLTLFGDFSRLQTVQESSGSLPFTFIDLFAGIGGMRLGLEAVGGQCVFTCEKDRFSQKTYNAWFGEVPFGDINDLKPADIPNHDVLAAGFPCQPFSLAGDIGIWNS